MCFLKKNVGREVFNFNIGWRLKPKIMKTPKKPMIKHNEAPIELIEFWKIFLRIK